MIGMSIVVALAVVPTANGQQVVAKVKVHNPSDAIADVVIRGTLPLPADYDKPVSGLVLSDSGRKLVTQASVFSTYPGSSDDHPVGRPEVVQLAAKASLPANSFKEFDVIEVGPNSPIKGASPGPAVTKLLGTASSVLVEATDVYGNWYRADALAEADILEVRQNGPVLEERIYQTVLTPVGQAAKDKPTIENFLRVRAYLTTFAEEDFATLSLMIYNGSIDDYSGPIYYRSIRVGVAEGVGVHIWRKDFFPAASGDVTGADGHTWVDCPPARADGKVFVMPYGSAAVLRTTLYATAAKERAIQYADNTPVFVPAPSLKLWSWSNFATARYGASKYPMPLDLGPDGLAETAKLTNDRLTSPTLGWDLVYLRHNPIPGARTLGHAMPAGVEYGGMTGGQGVGYVFGVRAAVTGHNGRIQEHILMADRNWDRQRAHLFHDDGKPFMYSRYVVDEDGKKLFDWPYDSRGFEKLDIKDPACVVQATYVSENKLLSAEGARLASYHNHDDQHLSRVFDVVPAAYLACDPLSRDRMVTLGSQTCKKLNIYPVRKMESFGGWGSLFNAMKHINANPHEGIGMDRAHGWKTHALGWAFCLSQDKQIREDCLVIARADVAARAKAQMPPGNVTIRNPSDKAFGGKYWFTTGWEEGAIMADGARAVVAMLSSPNDAEHAQTMKDIYRRVGNWIATDAWNEDIHSPPFHIGLKDKETGKFLDKPVGDSPCDFYLGSPLAWYYELTGDKLFLDRLNEMSGDQGLAARSRQQLRNWSYSLWLAQSGDNED
ncbi:MAG: hypothetical protein H8E44_32350 [Planctomycetes bacterium]|nr:hypothetical protein [Planctomycetota bacterium]MBL7041841.1 hypothetical protein [Pirellulaceae bacterium]